VKSPGEMIDFARVSLGLADGADLEVAPLTARGSDRTFFRLKWNNRRSSIMVHYDPKRVENTHYASIAAFLTGMDIPVPRVYGHDPSACLIIMEDLGDKDLWSFRATPWDTRRLLYEKTFAIVHRLHSIPPGDFPSDRVKLMEPFGPGLYRWERDYFMDHFVAGVCGMRLEPSFAKELEEELSALAERLEGTRHCLVHRDLQSQNVMIRDNEPYLIDFQGMRFGCPFYDLGSLLCDPYVDFSAGELDELLLFYYGLTNEDHDFAAFKDLFWEASAQRVMQALGAYGFLGLKKGLKVFLDHIPKGLAGLLRATTHVGSLPRLRELSGTCRLAIGREIGAANI
jgi:N-acetylmuramate 1-kinase